MEGIFITGTDTGVGKTTVSAGIMKLIYGSKKVSYWKPVQTGTLIGDDTKEIRDLTELPSSCFLEPAYRFAEPLAPYLAAKEQGVSIDVDHLTRSLAARQKDTEFLVIEGAGGILVPLSERVLLIDLIRAIGFPVLIVGANKLGVINSALLTINACRSANIPIAAVVLTRTRRSLTRGNAECITNFGKLDAVIELDDADDRRTLVSQVSCHPVLRSLFKVPPIPV